jgi:hypothetical protein
VILRDQESNTWHLLVNRYGPFGDLTGQSDFLLGDRELLHEWELQRIDQGSRADQALETEGRSIVRRWRANGWEVFRQAWTRANRRVRFMAFDPTASYQGPVEFFEQTGQRSYTVRPVYNRYGYSSAEWDRDTPMWHVWHNP